MALIVVGGIDRLLFFEAGSVAIFLRIAIPL